MKLINEATGAEVKLGDEVTSFRGEKAFVNSFDSPHKPGSTGRVYVTFNKTGTAQGYFPSVFGLKIVEG